MQSATTTTTTSVRAASNWDAKQKTPSSITLKNSKDDSSTTTTKVTTSGKTGGFFDCQTLWEQELHRYALGDIWTYVRIASLIAFPYVACLYGNWYWPLVVDFATTNNYDLDRVATFACGLVTLPAFIGHNLLYALLYYFDTPFLDRYRVDDKPWHWDMGQQGWRSLLRHTLGVISLNAVLSAVLTGLLRRAFGGLPFRTNVATLPTGDELLWQLLFCTVVEDFLFHHSHQLLHTKPLYWIHKIHHRYHAPIAIAAVYAHPIEYLLGNLLPVLAGPFILQYRMHAFGFAIWGIFRASASLENHSGYEFPWSLYQAIPFKAPTEYHDFHHNRNQETYSGVLRIWDAVYGTNHHYFEWVQAGRPDTFKTQKFKEQQQQKQQAKVERRIRKKERTTIHWHTWFCWIELSCFHSD